MSKTEQPTKHWKYRGDTKAVSFRLPLLTIEKLDRMAKDSGESKAQVLIDAIDSKESVAHL